MLTPPPQVHPCQTTACMHSAVTLVTLATGLLALVCLAPYPSDHHLDTPKGFGWIDIVQQVELRCMRKSAPEQTRH